MKKLVLLLSAVITPPDLMTMFLVALPLYLLCIWIYRKRELGLIIRK